MSTELEDLKKLLEGKKILKAVIRERRGRKSLTMQLNDGTKVWTLYISHSRAPSEPLDTVEEAVK